MNKPKIVNVEVSYDEEIDSYPETLTVTLDSGKVVQYTYSGHVQYPYTSSTRYKCVSVCPELDCDNSSHCIMTKEEREAREEKNGDSCPCGNRPTWIELT